MKAVTRARNPRGHGDRLRTELLEATADLIAETGSVRGISLRAVAKRTGVSPMAVYNHFADRDALLEAAVEHCWAHFQSALAEALDAPDPTVRLRASGQAYVRFALAHPGEYAVLFSSSDLPERRTAIGMTAFEDLVAMISEVLDAKGDERDPAYVAIQVHTWIHGIVTLTACAPSDLPWPPIDQLVDDLVARLGLD